MHLSAEKRSILKAVLKEMEDRYDGVDARILAEQASDPDHPMHEGFGYEWDDKKAANEYRVAHSRRLISCVTVEVVHRRKVYDVPVYIHDPRKKSGYTRVASIRTEREVAMDSMRTELSRALHYLRRAEGIALSLGLSEELIDRLSAAGVELVELKQFKVVA